MSGMKVVIEGEKIIVEGAKGAQELRLILTEIAEARKLGAEGLKEANELKKLLAESQEALRLSQEAVRGAGEVRALTAQVAKLQGEVAALTRVTEASVKAFEGGYKYGKPIILQAGAQNAGILRGIGSFLISPKKILGALGVTALGTGYYKLMKAGAELHNEEKYANPVRNISRPDLGIVGRFVLIPVNEDHSPDFYLGGISPQNRTNSKKYYTDEKGCVMCVLLPADKTSPNGNEDAIKQLLTEKGKPDSAILLTSNMQPDDYLAEATLRITDLEKAAKDKPKIWEFWKLGDATLTTVRDHRGIFADPDNRTEIEIPFWTKAVKFLPWVGVIAGGAISLMVPPLAIFGLPLAAASFLMRDKIVEWLSPGASRDIAKMQPTPTKISPDNKDSAAPAKNGDKVSKAELPADGRDMTFVFNDAKDAVKESLKIFQADTSLGAVIPFKKNGDISLS